MHGLLLMLAVAVAGESPAAVDFDNQIIPILTKAGCNVGGCHGAAAGRGGFRLSLYGGDPTFDYRSLVLELEGRRVNLVSPEDSLVLLKATGLMPHGGGFRLSADSAGGKVLRQWIADGAPRPLSKRLAEFEVVPRSQVVDNLDGTVQFAASARFTDGSHSDVTQFTVFTPEDTAAVAVDPKTAVAKVLRRGRHIVVARYLDQVVPVEIIVPLSDAPVDLASQPRRNFIDEHILGMLSTLRLPVSPQVDDAGFLRRATLDFTGRLPTPERVAAFLGSDAPDKRDVLVEELLASDEFNEYWAYQLDKLLRVRSQGTDGGKGALVYHQWLKQQVVDDVPYDQVARSMLTSLGDTLEVGPANFALTSAGAREQAEFASELFMGSRLRCANCHNHPLDRWTQDDYHGLAAIFIKIERAGTVVKVATRGEITHPRTGEAAVPRIPGEKFLEGQDDGRAELAAWLTDKSNPYFAKALVNRLWKSLMGRGLVESTDDFRATNPATHPLLLEELAGDFVAHNYSLRHTLRRIAQSAAYARSSRTVTVVAAASSRRGGEQDAPATNAADDRFYSHALPQPLEAEVLADAISDVIGVPDQYGDQPLGTRAVALYDGGVSSEALEIIGRCARKDTCESAGGTSGGLPQKLHLFNGALLNRRLNEQSNRLAQLQESGKSAGEIVDELYVLALGRHPSAEERTFWDGQLALAQSEMSQALQDFAWSLLSCREFVTNH